MSTIVESFGSFKFSIDFDLIETYFKLEKSKNGWNTVETKASQRICQNSTNIFYLLEVSIIFFSKKCQILS